jgi:hypothetical protein
MKEVIIACLLLLFSLTNTGLAEEVVRFDFQSYLGEGGYAFYRVDIDMQNSKGELCFFDTGIVSVSDDVSKQLSTGTLWSQMLVLDKVKHACFKFELYKPDGCFFSPSVKYGDVEYRIFFIGEINTKKINGKIYEFRYSQPDYAKVPIRNAETIEVSALGKVVKMK